MRGDEIPEAFGEAEAHAEINGEDGPNDMIDDEDKKGLFFGMKIKRAQRHEREEGKQRQYRQHHLIDEEKLLFPLRFQFFCPLSGPIIKKKPRSSIRKSVGFRGANPSICRGCSSRPRGRSPRPG
ncbi:hypothetical protein SDC9_131572 [bioreactor metagenome]|uniref:Uncharacterized protein n=1 Tax=bioreactor metagenome TaxID=1076179 RepID=A0A645D4T4_9ZZZZ